uniref:Uncharacterized protein n=1 Tax=Populus alba TaxID=43335 RepID=A0A4U5N850_POPAL|nr:hypothetical protein D5086_0000281960 [Populus alba]
MVLFRNSSSSTKRFLVIDEKYRRTSLRVYKPAIGPFAKKRSFKSIKHLTSWSLETSYELYGHGGLPQSVLQLQSSFPHSTTFLADLPSLDYHKRDGNATCKDYFPISDALEYTPNLPIFGTFYDEVIPSTDELNEADKKGRSFLPKSYKYIFIAFHKECQTIDGDHVMTLQDWVDFWFRDDLRYKVPFSVGKSSGSNKTPILLAQLISLVFVPANSFIL